MLITIKFLRVMDSKFSKIHPLKCSNRGARARCAGAGSAFDSVTLPLDVTIPSCQNWSNVGLPVNYNERLRQ